MAKSNFRPTSSFKQSRKPNKDFTKALKQLSTLDEYLKDKMPDFDEKIAEFRKNRENNTKDSTPEEKLANIFVDIIEKGVKNPNQKPPKAQQRKTKEELEKLIKEINQKVKS